MSKMQELFDYLKAEQRMTAENLLGDPPELYDQVVSTDRWDREIFRKMTEELESFEIGQTLLRKAVDGGGHLWVDSFFEFFKMNPVHRPTDDLSPLGRVNEMILDRLEQSPKYDELRRSTIGDSVLSAQALIEMRPHIERLAELVEEEIDKARQLQEKLQELVEQARNGESVSDEDIQEMEVSIDELAEALDDPDLQATMQAHVDAAMLQVQAEMDNFSDVDAQMWGLEPGELTRLPANERMALAQKLNSERLRKIMDMVGPMVSMSLSERQRQTDYLPEEIVGVETLVRWDAPEHYGVACKRVDVRERRSGFNSKPGIAHSPGVS